MLGSKTVLSLRLIGTFFFYRKQKTVAASAPQKPLSGSTVDDYRECGTVFFCFVNLKEGKRR